MDPFARYLSALEETMRQAVAGHEAGSALYNMLRYHLGWLDADFGPNAAASGKRLRPVFLLLACEAQGGNWEQALPAAAAVELLHNFSLIHDDIEDGDRTRRGRATLWTLWGTAQGINAGDALFAIAYRALLGLRATGVGPERVLEAQARFTETAIHLTEGQCLDIAFETQAVVDEATYLRMVGGKTAALLGLCCELGALIPGAAADRVEAARAFGYNLGMSFQMQDDMLGLWGDPAQTGKPVGADLRQRKKTLPILHGLAHSAAFRALMESLELGEGEIAQGQALLETSGSRAYTEARAAAYHELAHVALAQSGGSGPAQAALYTLAQSLVGRAK